MGRISEPAQRWKHATYWVRHLSKETRVIRKILPNSVNWTPATTLRRSRELGQFSAGITESQDEGLFQNQGFCGIYILKYNFFALHYLEVSFIHPRLDTWIVPVRTKKVANLKTFHVVTNSSRGGWDVRRGGATRVSNHHHTKREAIKVARRMSHAEGVS